MKHDLSARVCVIGAGSSGIAAAKNLLQAGLRNIVVYEKNEAIGGNWLYSPHISHSSVYETTHIISSKTLSQFDDYPMPADYPDYPSHRQVLAYFEDYARHFGVVEYIRFNTEVAGAEKQSDETWKITLKDGTEELFDYLIVANGHHWDPRLPSYPGEFTGEMLHSHAFKSATPFQDKRVLVIGGGNSACDIAVETSRVSAFTAISLRRGYYIVPKFTMGQPTDVMASKFKWLPRPLYKLALKLSLWMNIGDYRDYGLERPKHGLLEAHITMNSELLYYVRHGKIHPRRDVARFEGRTVHFVDGKAEDYDVVICATGFNISFPFFEKSFLDFTEGKEVPLYLLTFHPDHPSLFFVGLVQPLGSIWPLSDLQSKLAANTIIGNYTPPSDIRKRIAHDLDYRRRHFVKSPRHSVEVEYFPYRNALLREIPANAPKWGESVTFRETLTELA
jgi:hypothetical protein